MSVAASDGAGRNIGDEHNDFLPLYPGDRLPQEFGPCDLRRSLRADVCGSQCTDSHTSKTDTEKQERLPHSVLLRLTTVRFSSPGARLPYNGSPGQAAPSLRFQT